MILSRKVALEKTLGNMPADPNPVRFDRAKGLKRAESHLGCSMRDCIGVLILVHAWRALHRVSDSGDGVGQGADE